LSGEQTVGSMAGAFFFDPDVLATVAQQHAHEFAKATPFPHVVIDGMFPEHVLDEVITEFPQPQTRDDWIRFERGTSVKLAIADEWKLGPAIRHLLNQFNSATFVNFVEQLTGIEHLIPDPHYDGGGIHQIERGGYLKVHADFNLHERLQIDRRLNALLYLNRDWQDEWGGFLELWDSSMRACVQRIAPVFNRMVIFATTDRSYHGHPDPLECPSDTTRRSLALYYYSNGRPEQERSGIHSTLYQARPGEFLTSESPLWRDFIPPVVGRMRRRLTKSGLSALKRSQGQGLPD